MSVLQRGALEALSLPDWADLSEQQGRGVACVWCGVILAPATAVDLGPRRIRILDGHLDTFPRTCRTCVAHHAYEALHGHAPTCEQCTDNAAECETGRGLYRLVRENRR